MGFLSVSLLVSVPEWHALRSQVTMGMLARILRPGESAMKYPITGTRRDIDERRPAAGNHKEIRRAL